MENRVKKLSVKSVLRSFGFALNGICAFFREEPNSKVHLCAVFIVIVAGIIFKISRVSWMVILLCIGMVVVAEMFNTALEKLVDIISPDENEKAGAIKDMAAGAVTIASLIAAITGLIVFMPYLMSSI
jgi:diacylglycerol kinase (ATP)